MKPMTFRERQEAVRNYKSIKDAGFMLEELMAAMALVAIDGQEVGTDLLADPITYLDDWSLPDTQFYLEFFMTLNSIDEKVRKNAEELAKKLMGGTTAPARTGSGKAAKVTGGLA